jgi:Ribbon-helix-helix domain
MGAETVRWTVLVDKATDIDLRTYLARQGMKKGDLSKFIEEAVRWRLYDLTLAEFREGFADLSDEEAMALADEAVAWARSGAAI